MSGIFFKYLPGKVAIRYAHDDFDFINIEIDVQGDGRVSTPCDDQFELGVPNEDMHPNTVLKLYTSSVWCSFPSLIAWLEAVVCGVQECAFGWDAEGPEGRFQWSRSTFDTGYLTVLWDKDNLSHRVMLERRHMVGAIYGGFRAFAESTDYRPESYEPPDWFGSRLRELRSTMVEQWLALPDDHEAGDKHVH